ncbi:hypothetical protein [Haloferula sp.]|uniref:hypothetical protein n=1 Tax=Haloferula sp. TaxID=2497595 RepID=UPI00329D063B
MLIAPSDEDFSQMSAYRADIDFSAKKDEYISIDKIEKHFKAELGKLGASAPDFDSYKLSYKFAMYNKAGNQYDIGRSEFWGDNLPERRISQKPVNAHRNLTFIRRNQDLSDLAKLARAIGIVSNQRRKLEDF